jgi:proteic killer suppression protein
LAPACAVEGWVDAKADDAQAKRWGGRGRGAERAATPWNAMTLVAPLRVVPESGTHTQTLSRQMIASFRDEWLRVFFVEDTRSRFIPSDLESRLFRKLQMIDDATTDQDLRAPPSNHFEKLRGNLAGFHSIRVNSQWRLVFRWDGSRGEAEDVYLDDHSYR